MANVNWIKIKNEYISGNISHRKLAEKYNVSYNTLKDRAKREDWAFLRQSQHSKITAKSQQKTAEKIAEQESDYIVNINKINFDLAVLIEKKISKELTPNGIKSLTSALKDIKDIQQNNGNNSGKDVKSLADIIEKAWSEKNVDG